MNTKEEVKHSPSCLYYHKACPRCLEAFRDFREQRPEESITISWRKYVSAGILN